MRESKSEGDQLFELLAGRGRHRPGHRDHQPAERLPRRVGPARRPRRAAGRARATSTTRTASCWRCSSCAATGSPRSPTRCGWRSATRTAARAPDDVAVQMQVFLASDVVDTLRFRPAAVRRPAATRSCRRRTSRPSRFVPDIEWLQPDFVADQVNALRTGTGGTGGDAAPGLHGNGLAGVSLGGATLAPGASRRRSSCPADLAFEIQVQNQGENTENDVVVRVTVGDGGDARRAEETIDTIAAGRDQDGHDPARQQPATDRAERADHGGGRAGAGETEDRQQHAGVLRHLHPVSPALGLSTLAAWTI